MAHGSSYPGVLVDDIQQSAQAVAVWRPPTDRPAAQDTAVALMLKFHTGRRRALISMMSVFLVLGVLMILVEGRVEVLSGLLLLLAGWMLTTAVVVRVKLGRRLMPAVTALLENTVLGRVPARVVTWKGSTTLLAVGSGAQHLKVHMVSWGLRQIMARSGEVWLAGPDATGAAVVFADGMPLPLPAQTAPGSGEPRTEPAAQVSMVAAQDAMPAWYARRLVRYLWFPVGLVVAVIAALLIELGRPGQYSLVVWVGVCCLAALLLKTLVRSADTFRLSALLRVGSWAGYPVRIRIWRGNPRLAGELSLVMTLPDGRELPVTIRSASNDLVANISATGVLWVAGTPEAGKLAAVGVPGHPVAAPARFVTSPRTR
jgi:hypothetical protein